MKKTTMDKLAEKALGMESTAPFISLGIAVGMYLSRFHPEYTQACLIELERERPELARGAKTAMDDAVESCPIERTQDDDGSKGSGVPDPTEG